MAAASSSSSPSSGRQWPPGFRFRPTDQELVGFYLARKLSGRTIQANIIAEVDLYKCEPWDLPEKSFVPDVEWYFFSPRDRKYPNGWRTNRATEAGYWKATGKDRAVRSGSRDIGMKKTLVFYKGRAPHGQRTDWIMHEYRVDEDDKKCVDAFVVCRVFRKSTAKKEEETVPCYPEGDAFFSLDNESTEVETEVIGPVEDVAAEAEAETDMKPEMSKEVGGENDELDAFLAMLLDEPVPDLAQVMDNPRGELSFADPEGLPTLDQPDGLMQLLAEEDFIELGDFSNLEENAVYKFGDGAGDEEGGGECIVDDAPKQNSGEAEADEHSMFIMDEPYLLPPGQVMANQYYVGEASEESASLAEEENGGKGPLRRILSLLGSVQVLPASAAEYPGMKRPGAAAPTAMNVRVTVKMVSRTHKGALLQDKPKRSRYGGNLLFVFLLGSLTALFWMFVLPGMSRLASYLDTSASLLFPL